MLAVSDVFSQSETLTYAVVTIAFLAGAHLLLLIFRRAFRRRLPAPEAGNAGRLGIVTTFALGRRRQLVVVRRDDIEHLVMIGGPNDLVIESNITVDGRDPHEIDVNWLGAKAPEQARFKRLFPLAVVSGIAGAGAGLICGLFWRWKRPIVSALLSPYGGRTSRFLAAAS
jgi:Flagellar biosynthesis protein, FliO